MDVHIESGGSSWESAHVRALEWQETISELFQLDLDVVCDPERGLPEDAVPGAEVAVVIEADGAEIRRIHGVISAIRDRLDATSDRWTYRLRVVPRAFRMTLVETQEIYQDLTIPAILARKLEDHGLTAPHDVELRLLGSYPVREFVVQYRESDLAFISRLAEHVGIGFFFEHEGGRDKLVLTDYPAGYRPVEGAEEVPFHARGEGAGVFALEVTTELVPTNFIVQDYNHRTPQVDPTSFFRLESGNGGGVVEYGSHVKTPDEAARIAQIRAEERQSRQRVFEGESSLAALSAGRRTTLIDHPRLPGSDGLLIVEIRHSVSLPVFGENSVARPYANTFRAIPASVAFRPPRRTPRPRILGVVTGIVQPGPGGEIGGIARLDPEGRYTVQFHFDTAQPGDQKASRPVRMTQPFGGVGHGMHFPLRPGTEVALAFADGDPDRPVLIGALYNAQAPSPVTARNANQSRIAAASGAVFEISEKR